MNNNKEIKNENTLGSESAQNSVTPSGARELGIELRSEEVQEILTKVPHWMIRWGNVLFLALILLLLFVSWFVKYPDVIAAEALITTSIPPQKEYAKTSGKLEAILVVDNERVESGKALAIIENTANYEDVYRLKTLIDTIRINRTNFEFPIDSLPILFLGDIDAQYALFENSYIQYSLNKQLQPFSNESLANRFSISELNRRLQSLKSQKEINATELEFERRNLDRNQSLFDKGVISAQEFENKQLTFAQAERNYKNFESSISQIREGISNARKTGKGTEIERVKEEMLLLKNVIQTFNQLKRAIRDWEQLYVLQSNIVGKVSFLNYYNVNQTVNQGDLVFTIIPSENSSYIAKLKTPAQNSGKIKVGQTVNISIDNYPDTEFGTLKGTVQHISALPNKDGFYLIDVLLPETLMTSYNKKIEFKQEMIGSAEIITEDLRLIERFFYQFREILKR
ncbi:HlyD family efflux transporter periplasmic adaptor subunit [Subsaximicrobium wynnwilliamsii]|uniref:HlyD family efflux transporter periplasmic adaptor subunit n=1 Tax=Subsaximicrobium wynnwilliamsii TaxID=291179 RepID=A0A5C6ZGU5_9FLAO|nr:HlyD family efflux transporter periplasmic adaptor subunit [Subsaximicrobium wynnwilliamsii]TXD82441.1 HlyD family efflux transporter periplasmic adaptor subunit [Subsaximicrobium wynnwilliamsii]TXD88083.1 HlyD family efflux transporter periplasmic adaptor subunit [Subsaximicrobium wynnwilliamsii]TXE02055.1 HlyD family efflux transporter periplasmic adaptor subunit [Subsaximicrobium wynnwilliamsii]